MLQVGKLTTLLVAVILSTATHGFVSHPAALRPSPASLMILSSKSELNPVDEMCIENVAEFCLHEQCDVEEYEALVNQLEDQRDYMINHVVKVEHLLKRLKDSNVPDYDPDEVQALFDNIKKALAQEPFPSGQ